MLTTAQTVLSVDQARVSFGNREALRGLSLELRAGELLGLLGPNGAGKTTLINCLAGRRRLDSGRIWIDQGLRDSSSVGCVPQDLAIYHDLTVNQNLTVFGRLYGVRGRLLRERVAQALDWAQLKSRARSLAGKLSGGMQRRLNIACSTLHQPKILMLDEPTVGVDPQSRERIYSMLDDLLAADTAILMTTHQLEEVQVRCDRIAIIDAGVVRDEGSFEELLMRNLGQSQQMRIRFENRQTTVPVPLQLEADGWEASGASPNLTSTLPKILQALEMQGAAIADFTVHEPTLQSLFLHLTGRELRE